MSHDNPRQDQGGIFSNFDYKDLSTPMMKGEYLSQVDEIQPDWKELWTPDKAEEQLKGFKWRGPGWYLSGTDTLLVYPGLSGSGKYWFAAWNHRTPIDGLHQMVNSPVRLDTRGEPIIPFVTSSRTQIEGRQCIGVYVNSQEDASLVLAADMTENPNRQLAELAGDPEVLEWYDRMAELEYVPARVLTPQKVVEAFNIYQPPWSSRKLTPEQINDAVCSTGRRGYQIFATPRGSSGEDASYAEAESVSEAIEKCLRQFPKEEGYIKHGVKDIETQNHYFLNSQNQIEGIPSVPDSTSLNPPQTGFQGESDPEPLPLGEIEPPPLSLD